MKKCTKCKIKKEVAEFGKDKYSKDGHTYACKDCRNKRYNEWAEDNRDSIKEKNLRAKKKRQEYYQSNTGIKSSRKSHLKNTFNMTLEDYDKIEKEQQGVCAICEKPEKSERVSFLSVDHDHSTDKIRGLLCTSCNRALGLFQDNKKILLNAIKYLEKNGI